MEQLNTPQAWWALVNKHWPDLLKLNEFVGLQLDSYHWPSEIGEQSTVHARTLRTMLEESRGEQAHKVLHTHFEIVWAKAPNLPVIHTWPSWHVLCDLCSEYTVCFQESIDEADVASERSGYTPEIFDTFTQAVQHMYTDFGGEVPHPNPLVATVLLAKYAAIHGLKIVPLECDDAAKVLLISDLDTLVASTIEACDASDASTSSNENSEGTAEEEGDESDDD